MIVRETLNINGKQFFKTFSDENKYIEREDVRYSEAVDPINTDRSYIETNILIKDVTEELQETELL